MARDTTKWRHATHAWQAERDVLSFTRLGKFGQEIYMPLFITAGQVPLFSLGSIELDCTGPPRERDVP